MRSAYIGLVSKNGLESLLPENKATRCWSLRASKRHRAGCLWAHVDSDLAAELTRLVSVGECQAAWRWLAAEAAGLGPLI